MHLVAGTHELINRRNAIRNRGCAHVNDLGDLVGHQGKPDARLTLRIVGQEIGMTNLVANEPLALGVSRKVATTSLTLSQIEASTERSPFSPMS